MAVCPESGGLLSWLYLSTVLFSGGVPFIQGIRSGQRSPARPLSALGHHLSGSRWMPRPLTEKRQVPWCASRERLEV